MHDHLHLEWVLQQLASGWAGVRPVSVSKFASGSLKALLSLSEMANDLRDSKGCQYDMTMELQV
jgi:hypothetical protein